MRRIFSRPALLPLRAGFPELRRTGTNACAVSRPRCRELAAVTAIEHIRILKRCSRNSVPDTGFAVFPQEPLATIQVAAAPFLNNL